MSIDVAILDDPKIREVFAASLRARRDELLLEISKLNSAIDGLNDERAIPDAAPPKPQKTVRAAGKRMRKGEPERMISQLLKDNPASTFSMAKFKALIGISPSTAWRAVQKLQAAGHITQIQDGWFQWKTDLPVAGGNGKGAET